MAQNITFRDLSFKKKLEHIWEYYSFGIVAGVIALFLIISLIRTQTADESLLNVLMLDSNVNAHSDSDGFDEFLTAYGYEPFDGAVSLNANLSFYDQTELEVLDEMDYNQAMQENYEKEQILFTLMASGDRDVIFGKGDIFLSYADQGMMADLSAILSEELLARYADQLVYTDEGGTAEPYPCAVALSGNPWLEEHGYYHECYFSVLYLTDHPEIAAQFAEFLLSAE